MSDENYNKDLQRWFWVITAEIANRSPNAFINVNLDKAEAQISEFGKEKPQ